MKKPIITLFALFFIVSIIFSACAPTQAAPASENTADAAEPAVDSESSDSEEAQGAVPLENKTAVILVPTYADYFKVIADIVKPVLEDMGFTVEVLGAENDALTMVKQIQNYTVKQVGLMYIFPAGDASAFHDVVQEAHDAGIKIVISHNSTGEGTADAIIQADEFVEGTQSARMINLWVEETYPDAEPGTVKVLVLESSLIPDMIKRSAGIKLVGEKFLRVVDMTNARYVKTDGTEDIYYLVDGQEVKVDEPTGGLILDADGHAMLNPYYNEKVSVLEFNNRSIMVNEDGQKALDVFYAADDGVNADVAAIACYAGDACIGVSEKYISLYESGVAKTTPEKFGVFGADDTQTNVDYLLMAKDESKSVLRGVITAGDIIQSIVESCVALANGEPVEAEQWQQLGYMTANDDYSDVVRVLNDNVLPPTAEFFK